MDRSLCVEDVVCRKGGNINVVAVIERTNSDVDSHIPLPLHKEAHVLLENNTVTQAALRQFKLDGVPPKGAVYVRWAAPEQTELIAESQLELLHRNMFIGDIVNRGPQDSMSGVVLNVYTRCSLAPMGKAVVNANNGPLLSLLPFDGTDALVRIEDRPLPLMDIPASELRYEESPSQDDLVMYKGWVGRVNTMTTAVMVRLTDNGVVEIPDQVCELLSDHPDYSRVGDVVKTKKGNLRSGVWKFGQYNPNTPPIGSVVSTRATTLEIQWLQSRIVGSMPGREPPMVLERAEIESEDFRVYDRSRRPSNASREMTISNSEIETTISLRVRFRDLAEAASKYGFERIPRQDTLGYDMNVFEITSVSAGVTVQWQDLSISVERAVDLMPDTAIDDAHAAWPGEIAHSLSMTAKADSLFSPSKVGVIQCVKSDERMAAVRWCSAARVAYSKAEVSNPSDPPEADRVLVERDVAVADGVTEELSLYDVECPAELNVRRGDIVLVTSPEAYSRVAAHPSDASWLGEVVDTWLDGRLLIRLGAADNVADVALKREEVFVAIRSDGTDGLEGLPGDEMDGSEDGDYADDEGEWESEEEEMLQATYVDENGEEMDVDEAENEDWESDDGEDEDEVPEEAKADVPSSANLESSSSDSPAAEPSNGNASSSQPSAGLEPYAILETPVPDDHHYATQPTTSNPTHMKRTQKEHRILQSPGALPEGVYVRTWESRLDLFRVLIVGPEDTPYAAAPFIMDFHLPARYPQDPPAAHFHSWTGDSGLGGVGRVNPNLYEDGKICLSLLGTWEGNKVEGWNAAKSTLLQVLVSLLGLVLVREPYFNEAGYEPLAGLESSRRPSALYNERTFLRSSGFLISAVEAVKRGEGLPGLGGFEDGVRWLYVRPDGPGLLRRAVGRVEEILGKSDGEARVEPDGATAMSKGACIPLRRVLGRLKGLVE